MFKLPTYQSQSESTYLATSGAVRQEAQKDPGKYLSLAEAAGLRGNIQRVRGQQAVAQLVGQSVMEIAVIVAAGVGAAAAEPAVAAEGATAVDAVSGAAVAKGTTLPVVGAEAAASEAIRTEAIVTAMARQAFPNITSAYDRAFNYANVKITQADSNAGEMKYLEDQVAIDSEVLNIRNTVPLKEQDEALKKLFDEYLSAGNFDLSKGASEIYKKNILTHQAYMINREGVLQGQKIRDDYSYVLESKLQKAILNGSPAAVDKVIAEMYLGNPDIDPSERTILMSKEAAQMMSADSYKKIKMNGIEEDLSKLGYTGAISALNAREADGEYINYKDLSVGERAELVKGFRTSAQIQRDEATVESRRIEQTFYDKQNEYLSGALNFDAEFKKLKAPMEGDSDKRILAWWNGLHSAVTDSDKGWNELMSLHERYRNGDAGKEETILGMSRLATGDEPLLSFPTVMTEINSLDNIQGRPAQKNAEALVKPFLSKKEDDGGITAEQSIKVEADINELLLSKDFREDTSQESRDTKIQNLINDSLNQNRDETFADWFARMTGNADDYTIPRLDEVAETRDLFNGRGELKERFEAEAVGFLRGGDKNEQIEAMQLMALKGKFMSNAQNHQAIIETLKIATLDLYERTTGSKLTDKQIAENMFNYNGVWYIDGADGLYLAEVKHAVKNNGKVTSQYETVLTKAGEQSESFIAAKFTNSNANGSVVPPVKSNGEYITYGHFISKTGAPSSLSPGKITTMLPPNKVDSPASPSTRLVSPNGTDDWYLINLETKSSQYVQNISAAVIGDYELPGGVVKVKSFEEYQLYLASASAADYISALKDRGLYE